MLFYRYERIREERNISKTRADFFYVAFMFAYKFKRTVAKFWKDYNSTICEKYMNKQGETTPKPLLLMFINLVKNKLNVQAHVTR